MPRRVSATEARVHFGELMREVEETNQPVIVQRGGKDTVVVAPLSHRQKPELEAPEGDLEWWPMVEKVRQLVKRNLNGRELPDIAEMIRQMREERDEEILGLR